MDGSPLSTPPAQGPPGGEQAGQSPVDEGAAVAFFSRAQAGPPPGNRPPSRTPTLGPIEGGKATSKIGSGSNLFTPSSLPPVASAAAVATAPAEFTQPAQPVDAAMQQPAAAPQPGPQVVPDPQEQGEAADVDDPDDPAIRAEAQELINTVLGERYRIDEMIGVGGMGIVYRATHVAIGKPMAIKVLRKRHAQKESVAKRFAQEAQLSSKIKHPNVVDIVDYGETPQGCPYYVMEFMDGHSLAWEVDNRGRINPDRAIDIALQITAGLAEAHKHGVIHRDLKPDNIFLCKSTEEGRDLVKLLDFGIARLEGRKTRLTAAGAVVGTPEYMSPEQAQGKDVDPRADLYSLGVIVFEMLTAQVPFRADTMVGTLTKQVFEAPPPLRQLEPSLPQLPNLERVIAHLLDKNVERRPAAAADVARMLKEARIGDLTKAGEVEKPQQRATVAIGSWGVGDKAPAKVAGSVDATARQGPMLTAPQNAVGWEAAEQAPPKRPSVIVRDGTPSEFVPASARRSRNRSVLPVVVLGTGAAVFAALLTVGLVRYSDRQDAAAAAQAQATPTEAPAQITEPAEEKAPEPTSPTPPAEPVEADPPQDGADEALSAGAPTDEAAQAPAGPKSSKKSKSKKKVAKASKHKSGDSATPPVQRPAAPKDPEKSKKPQDPPRPPSVSLGDLKDPFSEK